MNKQVLAKELVNYVPYTIDLKLKLKNNNLGKHRFYALNRMLKEAKYLYNSVIAHQYELLKQVDKVEEEKDKKELLKDFCPIDYDHYKIKVRNQNGEFTTRKYQWLPQHYGKSLLRQIKSNQKSKRELSKKGNKIGKNKFKRQILELPIHHCKFNPDKQTISFEERNDNPEKGILKGIKLKGLNQLPKEDYSINGVKLVKKIDGFHLFITYWITEKDFRKRVENEAHYHIPVGIDFGYPSQFILNEGEVLKASDYTSLTNQVKQAQRELSLKKKGSKNYAKAKYKLNKKYQKLNNKKKEDTNRIIHEIRKYSVICFQDELLKQQAHTHGKSQNRGILGRVKNKLADDRYSFKTSILPSNVATTKTCSRCGHKQDMPVNKRTYVCHHCGLVIDRDINSVYNMILLSNKSGLDKSCVRDLISYQQKLIAGLNQGTLPHLTRSNNKR